MKLANALTIVLFTIILSSGVFGALNIPSDLDIGSSDVDKFANNGTVSAVTKTFTLSVSNLLINASYDVNYIFTPANGFLSNNINILNIPDTINGTAGSTSGNFILTASVTVPEDFSSVNEDLDETSFNIGTLKITFPSVTNITTNTPISNLPSSDTNSNEMQLSLQIENGLSLPSLKLNVGSSETSVSQGSTITVHAGDNVELVFTVKNRFSSNSDADFNSVNIKVNSDDLNIDEDEDITDLGADEEKLKGIDFDVDDEETGTFDVDVDVKGTDEFGGLHGFEYDFKIKVEASVVSNEEEGEGEEIPDTDNDGVSDLDDFCPNTFAQCAVDNTGCELDTDNDGICNSLDSTPGTEPQQTVQNINTQQSSNNEPEDEETKKEKTESTSTGTDGFIPFIIGFIIGLILTAAFFILIRS